ncbi:hypothetical protein DMB42_11850 [Nonomuraea sp. WAC 01424]|uniref:hypothetical protein n=1 Tax=Nonomuraea sp. WAC 01424 TaxID=2203200 RepID=UPI000F7B5EAC|nr:hypothetical protein [Nonomuraea sp. WAC 01424]RSN12864.1 hypothetical protein DMB42_11850 [Nonomuraea sp. WAC 01424]
MTELVFRDPPPPKKLRRNWSAIAEQLRQKPGSWAVVASGQRRATMATLAGRLNEGRMAGMPARLFEAVTRASDTAPGLYEVYVRYVGQRDGL